MHFKVPHKTSEAQAVVKVKRALEEARPQLQEHATITEEKWEENTLHFGATVQGKEIIGTLEVTETDFVVDTKLPLMWRLFEGRIEKMIAEQVKNM